MQTTLCAGSAASLQRPLPELLLIPQDVLLYVCGFLIPNEYTTESLTVLSE